MNKNSVIGILAVAAIALMVGIWIGQTKEIFMSELDQASTIPALQKKTMEVAPIEDMMQPEILEEGTMIPAPEAAVDATVVTPETVPAN
jgi:hypothetical protein